MANLETCIADSSNGVRPPDWGAATPLVQIEDRPGAGKRHEAPEITRVPDPVGEGNDNDGQAEIRELPVYPELSPAPENANK